MMTKKKSLSTLLSVGKTPAAGPNPQTEARQRPYTRRWRRRASRAPLASGGHMAGSILLQYLVIYAGSVWLGALPSPSLPIVGRKRQNSIIIAKATSVPSAHPQIYLPTYIKPTEPVFCSHYLHP